MIMKSQIHIYMNNIRKYAQQTPFCPQHLPDTYLPNGDAKSEHRASKYHNLVSL